MRKLFFIVLFAFFFFVSCDDDNKKIVLNNDSDNAIADVDAVDDSDVDVNDSDSITDDSEIDDVDSEVQDSDADENPVLDEDIDLCIQCEYDNRECEITGDMAVCGDCKNGYYEIEAGGKCELKGENGSDCDLAVFAGDDCKSGFCVDSVCCNSVCDGLCEGCNVDEVFRGTCSPVAAGNDPDNECDEEAASTCGKTGACDGAGACQLYDSSTICTAASCSSLTSSLGAAYCDGAGSCDNASASTINCSPYECSNDTGTCGGGICDLSNPCNSSYFCNEGTCELKRAVGQECTGFGDDACATGTCVLDDFNSDAKSYCVPASPVSCSKDAWYYAANYSFCSSSTSYKKCGNDASWGAAVNCPNTEKRACIPTGWATKAGYLSADNCTDESTGAVCNEDTTCQSCSSKYTLAGTITPVASVYNVISEDNPTCRISCLDRMGTLNHAWCASTKSTSSTHFCSSVKTTIGTTVGICIRKYGSGVSCTLGEQCLSGVCKLGKCL